MSERLRLMMRGIRPNKSGLSSGAVPESRSGHVLDVVFRESWEHEDSDISSSLQLR